ncbi:MAG: hypothetical protein R8K46_03070 [Mariprofundaceae bacterium]
MQNTSTSAPLILNLAMAVCMAISGEALAAEPAVVVLTQTGCQFLEPEHGEDQGFETRNAADCKLINVNTGQQRLADAKVLELKAGDYTFRVSNKNVPYELGFWLRGEGFSRLTLPSVSGGGIHTGSSRDYAINLKPGEYLYSCPLNPTPDYRLVVKP